jgi:hypothetical protein
MRYLAEIQVNIWSRACAHVGDQKSEFIVCKIDASASERSGVLIFCWVILPVYEPLLHAIDEMRTQAYQGLADDLVRQKQGLDDSDPSFLRSCNR